MKVKQYGLSLLVLLIVAIGVLYYVAQKKINTLNEHVYNLEMNNDSLYNNISARDEKIGERERRIVILKDSLIVSETETYTLKHKLNELKKDYGALKDSVLNIPVDESYRFLTEIAYPYEGDKTFPFNKPQVKHIHIAYLENRSLKTMNTNLEAQVSRKEYQLAIKDTIFLNQQQQIQFMENTRKDMDNIIQSKDTIIQNKEKEVKKERHRKHFWQIAGGAVLVIVAILAAGGN